MNVSSHRGQTWTRSLVVVACAAIAANLALLSGHLPTSSPNVAFAAGCPNEQVIFVKASGVVTGKGNVQNIKTRTQSIDQTCIADAEMHGTTHVVDTSFVRFAEVGWTVWQSTGGGTRFCQLFWESFDGVAYLGGPGSGPLVPCDTYMSWKLWVQPSSTRWKFWYDPELDGTYIQVGPLYGADTGFSAGIPEGETGRRGATGAYDHHSSMKFNVVGGNTGWQSWAGISLDYDTMSGYHYHVIDPAQYEVVAD